MQRYYIKNQRGMKVGVLDYGAVLTNIDMPLKNGEFHNVILSYTDVEKYQNDTFYLGATIGRYANRIDRGILQINQKEIQLSLNEETSANHLHGGVAGFNKKLWQVISHDDSSITLTYLSKNGEEGYPGNVRTTLTYKVEEANELSIFFQAQSDATTIVNLSNHCYFNLSDARNSIGNHELQVYAQEYTPLDERHLPYMGKKRVDNSFFDLRTSTLIEEVMDKIINTNYCFENYKNGDLKNMAKLTCRHTNRSLLIESTYPGLQVYFGNFLDKPFLPFQGVCLEPQFYPNSPNNKTFPSPYLQVGEVYQHRIKYSFQNF